MANMIITREYVNGHAQEPRGFGLWVFRVKAAGKREFDLQITDAYKRAKAEALRRVAEHGYRDAEIVVLP